MHAELLGKYRGRNVYRVPVVVSCNDSRLLATVARVETTVVAYSAAAAANWARDILATRPETEIRAYGPKGGEAYRYVGWFSAIGAALWGREPEPVQPALPFDNRFVRLAVEAEVTSAA